MIKLPKWHKKGLIYKCDGQNFFKTHCTRPIPFLINEDRLRIFFSSRDERDMPYPTFIDVLPYDPSVILHVNDAPLLELGKTGTFDDSGITPVSILEEKGRNPLMYYVGWKRRRYGVTIETAIGVAEMNHDGSKIKRIYEGPIIGQDTTHPILTAAPFVTRTKQTYEMWYCSGSEWREMPHGFEMLYTVFHAHSKDRFSWTQSKKGACILPKFDDEVISAPWVVDTLQGKIMWYSTRGCSTIDAKNYMAGVATSDDGINWVRRDNEVGIAKSAYGWDSEMICYPAIFNFGDKSYMFYSGNGVGKDGLGYAVAEEKIEILVR